MKHPRITQPAVGDFPLKLKLGVAGPRTRRRLGLRRISTLLAKSRRAFDGHVVFLSGAGGQVPSQGTTRGGLRGDPTQSSKKEALLVVESQMEI